MTALATGLHPNILEDTYRADEAIAHSDLRQFMRPKVMAGRNLLIGSALHACVLQPELAADVYVKAPEDWDLRTKNGKRALADFEADTGRTAIRPSEYETIKMMVNSVRDSVLAQEILQEPGGANEVAAVGFLEDGNGLASKALIDIYRPSGIWDLKTTSSPDPQQWLGCVLRFGYDSAAAYYEDVFAAAGDEKIPFRGWIVCSKTTGETWVHDVAPYHLASGRRWYQDALRVCSKAKRAGLVF